MPPSLMQTPFSRFGSTITVKEYRPDTIRKPTGLAPGIWLGGVHGFNGGRESFRVSLWRDDVELPATVTTTPSHLRLKAAGATADICIAESELVRLRVRGAQLCLEPRQGKYNYVIPQGDDSWLLNVASSYQTTTLRRLRGDLEWRGAWRHPGATDVSLLLSPDATGEGELALRMQVGFPGQPAVVAGDFASAVAAVAAEYESFSAPYLAGVAAEWRETAAAAVWLNWSCVVGPRGHFQRPSMLMSNNWMTNVWSWDHAINALALAEHHPQLAWDQLLTIFDHQLPTGQLPDFINDAVRLYSYVKPPIHGWILAGLLARNPWFHDLGRLGAFYEPLGRWTQWWLDFRCHGRHGLPEYYHGNDSGWDNGTVFDVGTPATSPDCAAFLVVQMEMLADLAHRLRRDAEAQAWREKARDMLQWLLRLWDDRRFRVVDRDGELCEASDSVFGCLPIVLGDRLPAGVRQALAKEIRRHLTEWGPATEHPDSPLYEADGYWRGPIWAPPTLILALGLRAAGEAELAGEIAGRFCRLCRQAGSFAENFDALTGAPLCDPAYTWTSSTFLLLAGTDAPTMAP